MLLITITEMNVLHEKIFINDCDRFDVFMFFCPKLQQ